LYRALLFDLDGTLAETDSLHLPTWVNVLRPHGIEVDEGFYRDNIRVRLPKHETAKSHISCRPSRWHPRAVLRANERLRNRGRSCAGA
jgi:beta-phosphoglucomutase-like phosphatase (HAD superfamily)